MQTIEILKQQENTATPVFLFECRLASGSVERWSTHTLMFEGQEYRARVLKHNVFEWKLSADEGADTGSKISLTLANADSYFSMIERTNGFKGAQLTVRFVFFSLKDGAAASDSRVVFRGLAGSPDEITESTLRITFGNRLSLQRAALPQLRIQKRCPWAFPNSPEQRAEAVAGGNKGQYSPFYRCGYSPGEPEGCGNLDADGRPYTSCGFTKSDCIARGMYDKDAAGTPTRRFGGVQFVPSTISVRGYGEKEWHSSAVQTNDAKYNDVVPLVYGTAWYAPPVVCSRNDGNLTRMEVLLGSGELERVIKVIVNGTEIPLGVAGANMTATGWYSIVSSGARTGAFNADFSDAAGQPVGDPYGSMALLSIVVPSRVSDGQSVPRIQVLADGLKLERFGPDGAPLGSAFSSNAAWVILDILRRSGWQLDEIDLPSFAQVAAYLDEPVPSKDLHGNATSIPRFQCNLALQRRRSAADLVRGVRNGSMVLLSYGPDGSLQMRVEGDLRSQQSTKPVGSNSREELAGGWPAYEFSDGSRSFSGILKRESGEPWFRIWSRGASETTNRLSLEFQDQFNEYQQDSLSLADVDDVTLSGQELNGSLAALGVANFDQAVRVLGLALRKSVQGNVYVELATSVRCFGLTPGDVIAITYEREGFDRTPFRVLKVSPATNFRTALITAQIHDDAWYGPVDLAHPGGQRSGRGTTIPRPLVGARRDEQGAPQFEITEVQREAADGTLSVTLRAGFHAPTRVYAPGIAAPVMSMAPTIRHEGGQLPPAVYYYAISGVDANGGEGPLSFSVRAAVASETNSNAVELRELSLNPAAKAINVYRGESPASLVRLAANQPLSSEFVDDGTLVPELTGPVDPNYDHANFYWRLELLPHTGVSAHSSNSIASGSLSMNVNEYRGAIVRIDAGTGAGQERTVLANETTSLTVSPPWDIEPDSSSSFCVAESSWRFGALTVEGPAEFDVPNRTNATVHVSGRSANARDEECAPELCPLTRWRIGGGGGSDSDIPPDPLFALYAPGRGIVELQAVSFSGLENTHTITAGTLTLLYESELKGAETGSIQAGVEADTLTLDIAGLAVKLGDVLRIESEIVVVQKVEVDSTICEVVRGSHGSEASAHGLGTAVTRMLRRVEIVPFVDDFFGSPASGSFAHSFSCPDVRICAAELFVTNRHGSGPVGRVSFMNVGGLRTLSGGQYSVQIDGFLATEEDAAPPIIIEEAHAVRDVCAVIGSSPSGGPVEIQLKLDGKQYGEILCIPDASTASQTIKGTELPPLPAQSRLTLDIVSVPQGKDCYPGRDLSVSIRL